MKTITKVVLAAGGLAVVAGGLTTGIALAERGAGAGKYGDRGFRPITKDAFDARGRSRFARIDANSDGILSADEIEQRLRARMERRRDRRRARGRGGRRFARMLRRMDADNDGKVTRAEFDEALLRRFARVDLDNSGAITEADLPPRLRNRGMLEQNGEARMRRGRRGRRMARLISRLRHADADGNGQVTRAEFQRAAGRRFERLDLTGDGVIDEADRDRRRADAIAYRTLRFIHRFGPDADAAKQVTRAQFDKARSERFARLDRNNDNQLTRDEIGRRGFYRMRGHRRGHHRWHRRGGERDGRRGSGRHERG